MSALTRGVADARRQVALDGVPPIVPVIGVLTILLIVYGSVRENAFTEFSLQELSNVTATLAILAVGQTLVVISGGFDFSAVALLAFLNALFVTQIDKLSESYVVISALILVVAVAVGAINGLLVGYLRVQSIIATIAMFFVLSGGALALLDRPGGSVSSDFSVALSGSWGPIPASASVMLIVALVWLLLKRMRFGTNLYAIGSSTQASYARGVPVKRTLVATYALAGLFLASRR